MVSDNMTLPQSELKKAMNNQKITIIGLAKEFKYSRQTLSRKRNDFMGGVELREKDLQKKFEKILLDEEIRRNSEAGKSVSAENRLAIRMTNESIKDCLKQLQLLSKHTSPIELSGCAPSENWKNAIIGSTPEEHLSEVNTLLSSLEKMLNELEYYKRNEWEIDEVEYCCAHSSGLRQRIL